MPPESWPSLVQSDAGSIYGSTNGQRTPELSSRVFKRRGSAPASVNVEAKRSQNAQSLAEVLRLKFALHWGLDHQQANASAPSLRSGAPSVRESDRSVPNATEVADAKTSDTSVEQGIDVVNDPVATDVHAALDSEVVVLPSIPSVEEDLILSAPLPSIAPLPNSREDIGDGDADLEKGVSADVASPHKGYEGEVLQDAANRSASIRPNIFIRTKARFYATYAPRLDPPLVLPTAPTDEEKKSYLHTNRLVLYTAGIFSFLSLTAGMWLFTISSPYFAWFGVFCGALQIYMGISYWIGLVGKDFDFEGHRTILEQNSVDPKTCPTVDIYLPCCKEPLEIIENTYKHVSRLEYPKGKLTVYVLDDGNMTTVSSLAKQYGFEYIVRGDRPRLKKAGNLRWAFQRTQGDFFNIYDADFCPRPDFLKETIPRMIADPEIAIVQTPQFFRVLDSQAWVEQGAGAIQELFYRVVQVNRDRWGASICVGSNAIYRRAALVDVGGRQRSASRKTSTRASDASIVVGRSSTSRCVWRAVYAPTIPAPSSASRCAGAWAPPRSCPTPNSGRPSSHAPKRSVTCVA